MKPMSVLASTLAAGLAAVLLAGPAASQDVTYLPESATYCDMFRGLSKVIPGHCAQPGDQPVVADGELGTPTAGPKTRGIRLQELEPVVSEAPPAGSQAVAANTASEPATMSDAVEQAAPPEALAIAMPVQFAYDSADLTPKAMVTLDEVAAVLNDGLMADKVIEIEGHADAHGPDAYNLWLSERRAAAVRTYLIERHGIAGERLPAIGKGEQEPYDPDPYAGVNRRVEFHNVTG